VLCQTKPLGGDLMLQVLKELKDEHELSPRPNCGEEGSYFGWPTLEDARIFREKGYRLA
jgi:hypothetical protein